MLQLPRFLNPHVKLYLFCFLFIISISHPGRNCTFLAANFNREWLHRAPGMLLRKSQRAACAPGCSCREDLQMAFCWVLGLILLGFFFSFGWANNWHLRFILGMQHLEEHPYPRMLYLGEHPLPWGMQHFGEHHHPKDAASRGASLMLSSPGGSGMLADTQSPLAVRFWPPVSSFPPEQPGTIAHCRAGFVARPGNGTARQRGGKAAVAAGKLLLDGVQRPQHSGRAAGLWKANSVWGGKCWVWKVALAPAATWAWGHK